METADIRIFGTEFSKTRSAEREIFKESLVERGDAEFC
jgi:hypothetical protein